MIKNIFLKNFKSFQSEEIPFNYLTVFSGINGMGKSSAIQSLLLLRQSFLLGHLNANGGLFLDGEYSKPGNGKDIFYVGGGENEMISIEIIFFNSQNVIFHFKYAKDFDIQPMSFLDINNFDFKSATIFNDDFFYLNADRLSPERDVFPASQSNIQKGNLGKHGQYAVHYISNNARKPLDITELKHPLAATNNLLDNIDAWMREISPGIRITPQFYPEINSARLGYSYDIETGKTEEFKPANVGYGITYVLPIITQLLISKPGQTIIIENPESHLHPSGQSTISKLCTLAANNKVQIIIETHSDHIINGILVAVNQNSKDEKIGIDSEKISMIFIDRDENALKSNVHQINIKPDGRIIKAPKNFYDQFSKDMKQIMGF